MMILKAPQNTDSWAIFSADDAPTRWMACARRPGHIIAHPDSVFENILTADCDRSISP